MAGKSLTRASCWNSKSSSMSIIETILQSSHFENRPPVLIDIGASGEINAKWKAIAPYSVCLAFDADDREFNIAEKVASGYKKLLVINRIVTSEEMASTSFYLTASPFCSSLLRPQMDQLAPWIFHSLFEVQKTALLPAVTISAALQQAGIDYLDWFKTDTQGTDLRLFKSIPAPIRQGVLAAEFEPGIMHAYAGEDKLYSVMQEAQDSGFWLSTMDVKGTQRLNETYLNSFGKFRAERMVRRSPCWAEVTYLKNEAASTRSRLLLFVFALLERQYGFALEIADEALKTESDPLFDAGRKAVMQLLQKEKLKIPMVMMKKQFNKLFARINA